VRPFSFPTLLLDHRAHTSRWLRAELRAIFKHLPELPQSPVQVYLVGAILGVNVKIIFGMFVHNLTDSLQHNAMLPAFLQISEETLRSPPHCCKTNIQLNTPSDCETHSRCHWSNRSKEFNRLKLGALKEFLCTHQVQYQQTGFVGPLSEEWIRR